MLPRDWASMVAQMVKNLPANVGDLGSIPGSGRSLGEGHGYPLPYSCLGNSMNRGTWRTTIHSVTRVRHHWVTNTFTFTLSPRSQGGANETRTDLGDGKWPNSQAEFQGWIRIKSQHLKNKDHGIWSHHFMAINGEKETVTDFILLGSRITVEDDCSHEVKWRSWKKSYDKPKQCIKKQRHQFAEKGPYSQSYGFSRSHVWMWELEGWT